MRLHLNRIYAVYVIEQGYRLNGEELIILKNKEKTAEDGRMQDHIVPARSRRREDEALKQRPHSTDVTRMCSNYDYALAEAISL